MKSLTILLILVLVGISGCVRYQDDPIPTGVQNLSQDRMVRVASMPEGETGRVVAIIDGDTIDVAINGQEYRVRYIGVNTPERDESCYRDATDANRDLVEGKTVRLVRDTSETDRYGRLLRYIYVDNIFVNATLVNEGYAEAVLYQPDDREFSYFRTLEEQAARDNRACHATGIFDDGNDER